MNLVGLYDSFAECQVMTCGLSTLRLYLVLTECGWINCRKHNARCSGMDSDDWAEVSRANCSEEMDFQRSSL